MSVKFFWLTRERSATMNIMKYVLLALLLFLLGGFGFLAFYDMPVPQEDIVREISVEK